MGDAKSYIESPNLVPSLIKTLKPLKIIGYSVIILCVGALCYLSIIGEWLQDSGADFTYGNLSAVVLTAAHLKLGSEGTIRLNILAHILRMMLPVENVTAMAEVKSILIVSHDGARR